MSKKHLKNINAPIPARMVISDMANQIFVLPIIFIILI